MIGILRVVENNKNEKESVDSEASRIPCTTNTNVENLNDRRNAKRLSKARDKVFKASSKINW